MNFPIIVYRYLRFRRPFEGGSQFPSGDRFTLHIHTAVYLYCIPVSLLVRTSKSKMAKVEDTVVETEFVDADGNNIVLTKCLIFPLLWPSILRSKSNEDIIGSFQDIQSTLGIIGALLLSVIYGRVGRSEDINPSCLWGSHAGVGEILLTVINHSNAILCLFITITSARTYIMLSCFPPKTAKKSVAKFGPLFLIDIPYIIMPPISMLFILDTLVRSSLTLPKLAGIITLVLSFLAITGAIMTWMFLDDKAHEAIGLMTTRLLTKTGKNRSVLELEG